jgi:hypothetical protein
MLLVNQKVHTIMWMVDAKRKTPAVVIEQIRSAILDGLYKPRERLLDMTRAQSPARCQSASFARGSIGDRLGGAVAGESADGTFLW